MTSILGIDLSSNQLNGCLLVGDEPPQLRSEKLGNPRDPLIERLRGVRKAVEKLTYLGEGSRAADPAKYGGHMATEFFPILPDWLVLEDCFGRNRNADRALNRTVGAIVASCPSETQIAIVSSGDWRAALGAKNTKASGHFAVRCELELHTCTFAGDFDEHELDAIGVALAWQRILASQATPEKASTTRGASAGGDT